MLQSVFNYKSDYVSKLQKETSKIFPGIVGNDITGMQSEKSR